MIHVSRFITIFVVVVVVVWLHSGFYMVGWQVNLESLERLGEYFERYRRVAEVQAVGQGVKWQAELARECESWEEALANVQRTASGPTNKTNVHLILHASDLCRQLSGVHAICCKSGKDRTGMGVTLEEARLLCDHLRVVEGRRCCKLMRRFGVRRDNVEANTGQRKYAFNDVQRLFLPKCFQPPQGSYSGGVLA
jgi:inositol polyphosphate-4-phosphatase